MEAFEKDMQYKHQCSADRSHSICMHGESPIWFYSTHGNIIMTFAEHSKKNRMLQDMTQCSTTALTVLKITFIF